MTLADFQPHVEAALAAIERETSDARRKQRIADGIESIKKTIAWDLEHGVLDQADLQKRLAQEMAEWAREIGDDEINPHPVRSVPMDLIAAAVIRRIYRVPDAFPIIGVKVLPPADEIKRAVAAIAARWVTPNGAMSAHV